jgi:hypothetical protein
MVACVEIRGLPARAAVTAGNPDEGRRPIEQCDTLPASASIELLTSAETRMVCEEMLRMRLSTTLWNTFVTRFTRTASKIFGAF